MAATDPAVAAVRAAVTGPVVVIVRAAAAGPVAAQRRDLSQNRRRVPAMAGPTEARANPEILGRPLR
jgi:hypothetical protein